jgi:predicted dehydrogenase
MIKTIRYGIVGTGGWANRHAEVFTKMPGVQVIACCDLDRAKAEAFAKRHGIAAVYDDHREMFARAPLNAVSVATNDRAHATVSLAAIKRGLHVLCEKPMATTVKDARKMAKMAQRGGMANMVNFSYRSASSVRKAYRFIEEGCIGKVIHVEASYLQSWLVGAFWGDWRVGDQWLWRMSRAAGSDGVLGDIGCHILDLTCYVVGDLSRIFCQLKNFDKGYRKNTYRGYKLDANESAILNVEFQNGAIGTIHTSRWATGHKNDLTLRVFGNRGGLELTLLPDQSWNQLSLCSEEDVNLAHWKTISCGKGVENFSRFIRSIRTGKKEEPTFAVGEKIQRYIEACFKSDRLGKPVQV